jgi:RND family efflux transporter MFP subunit
MNMLHRIGISFLVALALAACTKTPDKALAGDNQPLLVGAEDLYTIRSNALASGPSITGSIQPERRADLRAEVSAVVLQVLKENGDNVRRGDLLVRIDDTALRESLASTEATTRASTQSFEQSERQFQRMSTLRKSGMASTQQLEDAEIRRNNAQSDLAAARTREVQARQQLQRTEVRAPFDGIISDRKVSAGDTAQIGKELLKVIDPTSMRFEGLVSADSIGDVKPGQAVVFRVNGHGDEDFSGKVRRVSPAANAVTRQVEVLVDLVGAKHPKLAGLYAEGQIQTSSSTHLTIPATALVRDGDKTSAWRLKGDALQKIALNVGERDPRSGDFVVRRGLDEGDRLISQPSATLKEGQKVQLAAPPAASTKATSTPGN